MEGTKSLSRILKQAQICISEPMIIKLDQIRQITEQFENFSMSQSALEDEIRQTRETSEEIFRETEKMVRDLLEKARSKANEILNTAYSEAEEVKASAGEEARLLREESRNTGYEEGKAQALKAIEASRLMALEEGRSIVDEAYKEKLEILKTCQEDMIKLSMAVARKIIAGELLTNPQVVVNITREAVAYLNENRKLLIRVNPQEVLRVLDAINLGMVGERDMKAIDLEVEADPGIAEGGCRVESEEGSIDSTLETRWTRIEQSLLGEINDY